MEDETLAMENQAMVDAVGNVLSLSYGRNLLSRLKNVLEGGRDGSSGSSVSEENESESESTQPMTQPPDAFSSPKPPGTGSKIKPSLRRKHSSSYLNWKPGVAFEHEVPAGDVDQACKKLPAEAKADVLSAVNTVQSTYDRSHFKFGREIQGSLPVVLITFVYRKVPPPEKTIEEEKAWIEGWQGLLPMVLVERQERISLLQFADAILETKRPQLVDGSSCVEVTYAWIPFQSTGGKANTVLLIATKNNVALWNGSNACSCCGTLHVEFYEKLIMSLATLACGDEMSGEQESFLIDWIGHEEELTGCMNEAYLAPEYNTVERPGEPAFSPSTFRLDSFEQGPHTWGYAPVRITDVRSPPDGGYAAMVSKRRKLKETDSPSAKVPAAYGPNKGQYPSFRNYGLWYPVVESFDSSDGFETKDGRRWDWDFDEEKTSSPVAVARLGKYATRSRNDFRFRLTDSVAGVCAPEPRDIPIGNTSATKTRKRNERKKKKKKRSNG